MTSSLAAPATPAAGELAPPASPRGRRSIRLLRWLPLPIFGVPALLAAHHYGAAWGDLAVFAGYGAVALALPGTLVWRAAHRRSRSLAEDLAPGLAVGYVLEVLGYFAARTAGAPLLHLAVPAALLAVFAAHPALRRCWRADRDAERAPTGWIWATSGIAGLLLLWSCVYFMRSRGLVYSFNDADLPFHLALIGELKHHLPPKVPWLDGEPLNYHWFVYADLAATSWATGIEPETLLLRLYYLPLIGALPFALGAAARRLTGRWWPGPVAAVITLFGVAPYPYGWELPRTYVANGLGPVDDGVLLRFGLFASPTQTFAALLAVPLVMLVVDRLRGDGSGWPLAGLLAAFVAVIAGAKATYLPILLCGLLVVVAVTLVVQRRWHRPALACVALVVPGILFAQLVLFGGASQGMVVEPLGGLGRYGLGASTGLGATKFGAVPTTGAALVVITVVTVLAWVAIWGGLAGLFVRRGLLDPAAPLLLGMGAAGIAAVLLLNHYGFSQTWFLVAARPYLALAAAAGLAALVPRRLSRCQGWWLAAAAVGGATAVWALRPLGPSDPPTVKLVGRAQALDAIVAPNLLLGVGVIAAAAVGWLLGRRLAPALAGLAPTVVVAVLIGVSLPSSVDVLRRDLRAAHAAGYRPAPAEDTLMPPGTREAARWLRDHSDPDDLVATNAHCRRPVPCDNLHFWFSAFAERRFLVEGWGYTATVNKIQAETGLAGNVIPYWNQPLLAVNDAAFRDPGPATIDALRRRGVRWLMVDERDPATVSRRLAEHVTLRHRSGSAAIYQL
ncbi:hypothetical protein [Pilimelia columellifera]|uniref:Uncharacterized protein n=1 Tax=Pilimelia columellifera subsp. columellifera TaxID=706583 RepID=A0ABP6AZ05_9ACTN